MRILSFITFTIGILFFNACVSEKKPKKIVEKTVIKSNIKSPLDALTLKQLAVKNTFDLYLSQLKSFNTEAIIEMTYPKLFTVINGDIFKQYISAMINSVDIKVVSYDTNITKINSVTTVDDLIDFTKINYSSDVKILFLNQNLYNTEQGINFLYDVLIHKYGKENIEINIKDRTLSIKKEEHMLAIKEKDSDWKFLGDNKEYRKLYTSILPYEVLKILDKK